MERFAKSSRELGEELIIFVYLLSCQRREGFITEVGSMIPKYSSFLNECQYHKQTAKKQFLDWLHRANLPSAILQLYKLGSSITELRSCWQKHWVVLSVLTTLLGKVEETVSDGKKAVATITGVEVVQVLSGSDQVDQAKKVFTKSTHVQAALEASLWAILSTLHNSAKIKAHAANKHRIA